MPDFNLLELKGFYDFPVDFGAGFGVVYVMVFIFYVINCLFLSSRRSHGKQRKERNRTVCYLAGRDVISMVKVPVVSPPFPSVTETI